MPPKSLSLWTVEEMYAADRAAQASGVPGLALMETAGWQVVRAIRRRFARRPVLVLAGPGNNGGDGFVAARLLEQDGWPVRVALAGNIGDLRGDAKAMAERWSGPIMDPLAPDLFDRNPLVIDALFGAGLNRPLDGAARALAETVMARHLDVVAVDIPSGVHGNSGEVVGGALSGVAIPALLTVTFGRAKPGHLLLPGRVLAGTLVVADIGIPPSVSGSIESSCFVNGPALWSVVMPWPEPDGHKYRRGHLLVAGGAELTGAARLAAEAARRVGAGLVSIVAPEQALAIYRADRPGCLVRPLAAWPDLLADRRVNACVLGPGLGVGEATRGLVIDMLGSRKSLVIDADALTSFAGRGHIFHQAEGEIVLTPHDGEYDRLFRHEGDRLHRARRAAAESASVLVLKGGDCVVAAPDGRAAIAVNAPPTLATAGSGDVLSGLIGGLLAQGMPAFEAAAAAVWLHGEAAGRFGAGLIAEDIACSLPAVLNDLARELTGSGGDDHGCR